mmetsp:Transcript_19606/g.40462  ORF Transcript_19606/g.40462 Transcript_19606/m.40462 type:complete len:306 (+) Transcript_19606:310-1227(+)
MVAVVVVLAASHGRHRSKGGRGAGTTKPEPPAAGTAGVGASGERRRGWRRCRSHRICFRVRLFPAPARSRRCFRFRFVSLLASGRGFGRFAAGRDHQVPERPRGPWIGFDARDEFLEGVHPLRDLSENNVLPVEVGDGPQRKEELRGICVLPAVGHGEQPLSGVVQEAGGLVPELPPGVSVLAVGGVDRCAPAAVSGRKVAGLEAKAGNDPVDLRSGVGQGLSRRPVGVDFTRAQAPEILGRQRGLVGEETDGDSGGDASVDREVEVAPRAGSLRWGEARLPFWLRGVLGSELAKELVFLSLVLL